MIDNKHAMTYLMIGANCTANCSKYYVVEHTWPKHGNPYNHMYAFMNAEHNASCSVWVDDDANEAYISNLVVDVQSRRQGLSNKLICSVQEHLPSIIKWHVDVYQDSEHWLIDYYKRLGFVIHIITE